MNYNIVDNKIKNNFHNSNIVHVVHQYTSNFTLLKTDSGASKHFLKQTDTNILKSINKTNPMSVILPNKKKLLSKTSGQLQLHPSITKPASTAHVLPGMTNSSLLFIGQLCDDDCIAVFHKLHLNIFKTSKTIFQGMRNSTDGL